MDAVFDLSGKTTCVLAGGTSGLGTGIFGLAIRAKVHHLAIYRSCHQSRGVDEEGFPVPMPVMMLVQCELSPRA